MTDDTKAAQPACTGSCGGPEVRLDDLPCGCQDVQYVDGTVCYEHNHVICDGKRPEPPHEPGSGHLVWKIGSRDRF
jgi:hypothetical protein